MALVVENGTGVTGANSYADLTTIRAFAAARGITLNADDAALEAQVLSAMTYIEGQRGRFQGKKTNAAFNADSTQAKQPLQWPRTGVQIDCYDFDDNAIPAELVDALCQLVIEQHNGLALFKNNAEGFVIEKTVGPITKKYSDRHIVSGGAGSSPDMPAVDTYLNPLFAPCGNSGVFLELVRV